MSQVSRATLTPEQFHHGDAPVYDNPGQTHTDNFRSQGAMADVQYQGSHDGSGQLTGRWVFCEEPGKQEGVLQSGIELFMDSRLEPYATIGRHKHTTTEEIYYLLEGSLQITLITDQDQVTRELVAGDAHLCKPGQQHQVQAGPQGARIVVVAAAVKSSGDKK